MGPVSICDFEMETQKGEKFTRDDLKGSFSILMFGQSVSDHAMQGLAKLQEIVTEQGRFPTLRGVADRCLFCVWRVNGVTCLKSCSQMSSV